MENLRLPDVVARVVAWHNRQPLARRIGPADVGSVGVVSLPFATPVAPGGGAARGLFDGRWLYGAGARRLGRWAARHAVAEWPVGDGWPQRQIDAELPLAHAADAAGLTGRTLRHALTAVVDRGGQRTRLLLAAAPGMAGAPVFGTRLWSPVRSGAATALLLVAVAGGTLALRFGNAPPADAGPVLAAAPPSAEAAQAAPAAAPGPDATASANAEHAPEPATQAAPPPSANAAAPAVERPADVPIQVLAREADAPALVQIRPRLAADERRGAAALAAGMRAAPAAAAVAAAPAKVRVTAAAPVPAPVSASASTPASARTTGVRAAPDDAAPVPSAGAVYALATTPARSRDHALALRVLVQGLQMQSGTATPTRVDLMQAAGGWRVVWWPHPARATAEALQASALERGLKLELVDF